MDLTATKLKTEVERLYSDINECNLDLIKARVAHDELAEGKALFAMVYLTIETKKVLACVNDYLSDVLQNGGGKNEPL